jgi:catechol 2,3-dioxygenase-like lactoylglutathione lyase family enzyme
MRVKRIGYLGLRTHDVDGMTGFFRDVLGLEPAGEGETVTFQRLPTHRLDLVEVYAPDHHDLRMIPDEADFVVAFVVDDIREALAEVQAAGLDVVNEVVWAAEAFDNPGYGELAWFWVRAPDGRVYVIEQVPD